MQTKDPVANGPSGSNRELKERKPPQLALSKPPPDIPLLEGYKKGGMTVFAESSPLKRVPIVRLSSTQ
jgi:hypothetical protein